MKNFKKRIITMAVTLSALAATACAAPVPSKLSFENAVPSQDLGIEAVSSLAEAFKGMNENNPISSDIYFADPTAVEYNGRLYIYGTNDSQEFVAKNGVGSNGYGAINTLAVYSTDDMSNYRYEGTIPVTKIATWAFCSWAPSIVSKEVDGVTHFYLYFANSGNGVGVLTSTSPVGPWEDPIGGPLVWNEMPQLKDDPVTWCFDPGACVDDKGNGWIAIGGGDAKHPDENGMRTGNCRLAKLGADMVSIDGDFVKVPTYYHFEANELNFINGKWVLTYCSNYAPRDMWKITMGKEPQTCSMCYMVSDDPLNIDSWQWGGEYLTNPNQHGYPFSNNHSHLHKFGDKYYLFYQNVSLLENMGKLSTAEGFRSIGVDYCEVDEENVTFAPSKMSDGGVEQVKALDPFAVNEAETAHTAAGVSYKEDGGEILVTDIQSGDWIGLTNVDFKGGANLFGAVVKGKGAVEIRIDKPDSKAVGTIQFDTDTLNAVSVKLDKTVSGVHDLYLVFGGEFEFDKWQFGYEE